MILLKHELKQNRKAFLIWTIAIGFFIAICIFIYPEMKKEMNDVSEMFSSMGSLSAAFGMDQVSFGSLIGFYSVECGNILGIGGAFFASLISVSILAKEEKEGTAEFLLAHPVSRTKILTEKLLAVLIQIIVLNLIIFGLSAVSIAMIGEKLLWKELLLLHLAYFLMQLELASVCYGISAFLRQGSLGIGLGVATVMYFLNIIANISEKAEFLKYITPFGYTEGSKIISGGKLDIPMILLGMLYAVLGLIAAYWKYNRKDIH